MSQVTQTQSASPQLLSLLETVSNPVQTVTLNVQISGVFSFPEQWKLTDEANPNMFGYSVQFLGLTFQKGKIQPRQLTEKEIKEAEQAKNKKNVKKDSKVVEEEKKLSPEEEEAERIQKEEWDALSELEKFYRTAQNSYKSSILKFEKTKDERVLNGEEVSELKSTLESGFVQITLTRKPEIPEEEIAKLKKAKSKNLNTAQLFKLNFKGKIDVSDFIKPGFTQLTARVKLQQQEPSPEAVKFEMKQCYLLITLSITPSIVPLVTQISPPLESLFVLPPKTTSNNLQTLISKLKSEIVVAVKGINSEYEDFIARERQEQISKNMKHKQHQKKVVDFEQKKMKFLGEFESSGKFKALKIRFQMIISEISIDKIKKERTINAPKTQDIQRKLVELGVFFNQQVNSVINSFISTGNQPIHEDLAKDFSEAERMKTNSTKQITTQTKEEMHLRVASEYQIINNTQKSESNYQNLILLNPQSESNLLSYINFCLKYKKFEQAEMLTQKILELNQTEQYLSLMGALLLRRKRYQQSLQIFTKLSKQCQNNKAVYYQICAIIYRKLQDKKSTVNTRVMAEKMYKMKIGLPVRLDQQEDPYQSSRPKPPKTKPPSLLTPEQTEDFEYQVIKFFAKYNMHDLAAEFIDHVKDSVKKELEKIEIEIFNQNYSQALKLVEGLLKSDKNNLDLIILKADICYLHQMLFEAEQTYLLALKLKPDGEKLYRIYLRLGHTYLKRKAWEDSKTVFKKACTIKNNSSLSWFALGISHLRLKQLKEAEQALYLANIYEPLNTAIVKYLLEIQNVERETVNSKYLSVGKFAIGDSQLAEEIVW